MFAILSHNNGEGARALAEALGCRLLASSEKALPRSVRHVINFGVSSDHEKHDMINRRLSATQTIIASFFNHTNRVRIASSKLESFRRLQIEGVRTPTLWADRDQAHFACLVEGVNVVARTLDRASEGRGIEYYDRARIEAEGSIAPASVYTAAINKGREYRVHVGVFGNRGYIIDVQRKIRRPGVDDTQRPFIWNHGNDFIFVRDGVTEDSIPRELLTQAVNAVKALRLDFGAVDIVVERRGNSPARDMPCYVLEVNTAPGMTGRTVARYAEFFKYRVGMLVDFARWGSLPADTGIEEV